MTPETPQTDSALPSTHFQTVVKIEDGTEVGLVVLLKDDGTIQFFLDRQLDARQFGPQQIVEVQLALNFLTNSLNQYVNDRIIEAKAAIEKENQPELPLDEQSLSVSTEPEACETGTCYGGCGDREVSPHAGLPE